MESVPESEIASRVSKLKEALAEKGPGLVLIRQTADLFYYTGAVVDGFLAVPRQGEPLLLVRRPRERTKEAGLVWPLAFYQDLKEIPALLSRAGIRPGKRLGLELDVLPAGLYRRLRGQIFPQQEVRDISPLIRLQRMVKSAYELEQVRRSAAILDQVYAEIPSLLRPGVSELEVAAAVEYRLRLLGHQGLIRVRTLELEIHYGHVLSGVSGLWGAYTDTPSGGPGFSPAFPQGPGRKQVSPGEPVYVDIAACVNGYVADMTRLYVLGDLPGPAWEAFRVVKKIYQTFASLARPGARPADLHEAVWSEARAGGLEDCFMGPGAEQVSFVAHGVGLELDEYPFLTPRFPYELEAGTVLAFEPKFFLPGIGIIGMEDTGRITAEGVEWLTTSPRRITLI